MSLKRGKDIDRNKWEIGGKQKWMHYYGLIL